MVSPHLFVPDPRFPLFFLFISRLSPLVPDHPGTASTFPPHGDDIDFFLPVKITPPHDCFSPPFVCSPFPVGFPTHV